MEELVAEKINWINFDLILKTSVTNKSIFFS